MKSLGIISALIVLLAACQFEQPMKLDAPLIKKASVTLTSDIMSPEVLWSFGRLSDVQVSPDEEKILYGVTYLSVEQNKSNRELFVMNADGTNKKQITRTPYGEYNAVWHPKGEQIWYLSAASGSMQIWSMQMDGSNKHQISDVPGDISNFIISPLGKKVLFTQDVKIDKTTVDIYPDLPKADGRIIDDLMYRHWDVWEDGSYSHIFVASYDGSKLLSPVDIMPGEPFDTPLMPFGGIEEISWTPDGQAIAYTCKKLKGKAYTLSTNSDIYLYHLATKETQNLTDGMAGYDRAPFFSPDGKKCTGLAWNEPDLKPTKTDYLCLIWKQTKNNT